MTTWVLLRGLSRSSGHWGTFQAQLQRRLGATQVVALDLPGNGALNRQRSPLRVAALTDHCLAELQRLEMVPPFHVVAVSMGAMVAADWSARAPHTLAACVLINTSARGLGPWHRRLRLSSHAALLSIALGPRDAASEATLLRLTSRNAPAAAAVLGDWVRLRGAQPVAPGNALRQLIAAARFRLPDRAPDVPILVLVSQGDALVDPRCSTALAQRWCCRLATHPWAGHDLTLDDGEWVIDQIERWLQR